MNKAEVYAQLDRTHIRREQDQVVPINGQTVKLPYMVIRTKETEDGDDLGRLRIQKTEWTVALFTKNRDDLLTAQVSCALSGVGHLEITRFPDGIPYQTNFKFTTRETIKKEEKTI